MTDFDYEVLQKKRLVRQSKGVIHSKRYVSLPHDRITRKEWESMNGEIITKLADGAVTPRKPMIWEHFKSMADEQQRDYLKMLQETFGVDMKRVASVLGVSNTTLSHRCSAISYEVIPFKATRFDKELWDRFVTGEIEMPDERNDEQLVSCDHEATERPIVDSSINNIPGIESSLKAIIDALKGTGAKITIEVTL